MAVDLASPEAPIPQLDGRDVRVGIVCARFNARITLRLLDGSRRGLRDARVKPSNIVEHWVPGAFELPLAAKVLAQSGDVDAMICLGCVIRGETTHYELVSNECAAGIRSAQLETGIPVLFGVLTTETPGQARARSEESGGHNVGEECAAAAIEMVTLLRELRRSQ